MFSNFAPLDIFEMAPAVHKVFALHASEPYITGHLKSRIADDFELPPLPIFEAIKNAVADRYRRHDI